MSAKTLLHVLGEGYFIIFLDEMSIKINILPDHGYSPVGVPIRVSAPPLSRNYTVIAAMSCHSMLGCQILQGGMKKEDYSGFLTNLINSLNLVDS